MDIRTLRDMRELIDFAAQSYGERAAFRFKQGKGTVEKSYLDLKRDSEAFSRALEREGLLGKHIGVVGPTSYEWVVAYFGTVNSGGVIVPIDKELPAAEICDALRRADVSALVYDDGYADLAAAAKESCPQIARYFNMQGESDLPLRRALSENAGAFSAPVDRDRLCTILYTSGTTGKSKGVMLCHRNLMDNVTAVDMGVKPASAALMTVLPIHHAYCFTCDILIGIQLGCTICVNDSLMRIGKNLQLFKPDIMLVVPMIAQAMYRQLSEAAKKARLVPKKLVARAGFGGNLRTIYCGGAYLNPELIGKFREFGIKLVQGYGMTECSPRISCNFEHLSKEESVGRLVDGCEAKVVDGEIWVKSSSVMLGYYHNEEATREALTEDGWLRTGDLGYVDEDRFLYITGRKKNLIILENGENVSPEELENLLCECPLVAEVLVYEEDHVIAAEVFPDSEYAAKQRIADPRAALERELDRLNRTLPPFKRVHKLKLREEPFEKTTSRKIKRRYGG